ncbi:conserved hypothetical protein [Stenotrophomonas maltophilia]|nr:conserved hypothetical protein [Stenotrophomonas maltophilia]
MAAPEDLAQSAIYRHPSDTLLGRMLYAPRWTRLRRALSRRWPMPAPPSVAIRPPCVSSPARTRPSPAPATVAGPAPASRCR